jgi:hydroxypyruvate reductase
MIKEELKAILLEGVKAADPELAVVSNVFLDGEALIVCGSIFDLRAYKRIIVVGAGKASERMAAGIEKVLGSRIDKGVVVTKRKTGLTKMIEVMEGSHPLPDKRSIVATEKIIGLLDGCGCGDLVIVLISGGGSSLLCRPKVSLEAFREVTEGLMKAGADIRELNTVRKKLSSVKGGRLAALAGGADVLSLIISDVVGDDLEFIASGPTVSDSSTKEEARQILEKYGIANKEASECLSGKDRAVESSAKNFLIATNRLALEAIKAEALKRGYKPFMLSSSFEGEASQIGKFLCSVAKEIYRHEEPFERPALVLCGGEAVVNVRGNGRGGPNMEIAASFALNLGETEAAIACMASDGEDGSTTAAGAYADNATCGRADEKGLEVKRFLENNDTLTLFERLDDLIVTGSTGTNVNSFWLFYVD